MKDIKRFRIKKPIEQSKSCFENFGKTGLCEVTDPIGCVIEYKNEDGEISYTTKDKLMRYKKDGLIKVIE